MTYVVTLLESPKLGFANAAGGLTGRLRNGGEPHGSFTLGASPEAPGLRCDQTVGVPLRRLALAPRKAPPVAASPANRSSHVDGSGAGVG